MSRTTLVSSALAIIAALVSACDDNSCPMTGVCDTALHVPIVVSITPMATTALVGDQIPLAISITGGSPVTPPTLLRCELTDSTVAAVDRQTATCLVTAIAPGTTKVLATSSIGSSASASLTVLPRAAGTAAIGN